MADRSCLIIDDVEAALGLTTACGAEIMGVLSHQVRTAVVALAHKRSWTVVPHKSFAKWALEVTSRDDIPWLVLDPLFPRQALIAHGRFIFASRTRDLKGASSALRPDIFEGLTGNVGIIDDAASTGRTLISTISELSQRGLNATRIALCASSRAAREAVLVRRPALRWEEYLRGDWEIAHLRDGCPFLPFSGRGTGDSVMSAGSLLEVRVISTALPGGLWRVMDIDRSIHDAIRAMRLSVRIELEKMLARPAVVADLQMLGGSVPVVVEGPRALAPSTRLDDLDR